MGCARWAEGRSRCAWRAHGSGAWKARPWRWLARQCCRTWRPRRAGWSSSPCCATLVGSRMHPVEGPCQLLQDASGLLRRRVLTCADWEGLLQGRGLTEDALCGPHWLAQHVPPPNLPYVWHELPVPQPAPPDPPHAEDLAQQVLGSCIIEPQLLWPPAAHQQELLDDPGGPQAAALFTGSWVRARGHQCLCAL